jgi:DNA-binding SARP family transcriptional activator/tetratricopeptide (TPR) repeat protein
MSQLDLARRAGIGVRTLRDLESDRVSRPRVPSVERLVAALALSGAQRDALLAALGGTVPDHGPDPDQGRLRVAVLGPLTVLRSGVAVEPESAMQRTLLGLLALHPRQVVGVAEIVDVLWGDDPPQSSPRLVHLYVAQLRRLLEPGRTRRTPAEVLRHSRGGYLLDLDGRELDLSEFDDLVLRAGQARAGGDGDTALELLGRALRTWRGPALADVGVRLAEHPTVVAVNRRRLTAALAFADLAAELGRHEETLVLLRPLAAAEPLHEGLAARLITALAGAGEKAAALRLFDTVSARLDAELGVEPGPELRSARRTVLREPAAAATGPVPAQLPADIAAFAGRIDQLKFLDALLAGGAAGADRPTAPVVCTVAGTPGVGKTALVVHWAHQVREQFPDGQLYVNLRGFDPTGTPMEPADAIRGLLGALGVPADRIPADPAAQVGLYRSLFDRRRMLVVLDNARDAEQVRPLLPAAPGCLTVVTSRHRLASLVAVEGAHPLTLDLLSAEESRQLLARRLGAERMATDPDAVDEIVSRCARLPLALAIAAARAAIDLHLPLDGLARDLHDTRGGLDALDAGDEPAQVRAVFSWSYRHLSPPAARLFRLLGSHPGPDCSAPAAASLAGVAPAQVRPLVRELVNANLLAEAPAGRYSCHDLLRAYAAELAQRVDSAADRRAATRRMLDHYLHTAHPAALILNTHRVPLTPPPPEPGVTPERLADHDAAMDWFATEYPVLRAAVYRAADAGFDAHTWHLAWSMEDFLDWQGHWPDWTATQLAAVAAAERLADRDMRARAHQNLGIAYSRLGRYDDAQAHLLCALTLFQELDYHIGLGYCHHNLGMLFSRLGRHDEALDHSERSLQHYRAADDTAGQASALNAIGWHHVQLGNHREAIEVCERAVALQQEIADRYGQANTWDTIGFARHHLGDLDPAADCYQRAIDLYREVGDRWGEANTLDRLGDTHHAAGRAGPARQAWQRALEMLDRIGDSDADRIRAKLARR